QGQARLILVAAVADVKQFSRVGIPTAMRFWSAIAQLSLFTAAGSTDSTESGQTSTKRSRTPDVVPHVWFRFKAAAARPHSKTTRAEIHNLASSTVDA
ncbi:MAG: hypothetical protein KDA92_07190, partial [Planctomycetales bacterium]|nr:hypothetical protein [Planctomycetales bacterium]